MGQARWWLSVLIAFGALFVSSACGSSTEIPTVAEDPWATPEEEEPEPDAGKPDAGPDISTFPPCGNGGKCNPSNLGGETCLGLGMGDGILACDAVTCTYDTSMCEGTGNGGNGGNGSVGVGNGNGNGSMGGSTGGGEDVAFFGGGAGGSGDESGASGEDSGNTPQFFGFFGGDDEEGNSDRDSESGVQAPMDGGSRP
jgi:hypothetical protein